MSTPPLGSPKVSPEPSKTGGEKQVPTTSALSRYRRWFVPVVGLSAVALAYGVGRVQGALALERAQGENAKAVRAEQERFVTCDADRHLLEARRSLSLVALSLDRRNFGVAETHRRSALQELEQASLRAVDDTGDLAAQIRGLDLAVDPDPGAQRERVITIAEALDRVLAGRAKPATVTMVRQ